MPLNGAVHSFGSGHYKTFFQHWAKKSSLIKKASFTYDHMSFENRVRGDFFYWGNDNYFGKKTGRGLKVVDAQKNRTPK